MDEGLLGLIETGVDGAEPLVGDLLVWPFGAGLLEELDGLLSVTGREVLQSLAKPRVVFVVFRCKGGDGGQRDDGGDGSDQSSSHRPTTADRRVGRKAPVSVGEAVTPTTPSRA